MSAMKLYISILITALSTSSSVIACDTIQESVVSPFVKVEIDQSRIDYIARMFDYHITSDHKLNSCSHIIERHNKCGVLVALGAYCQIDDESVPKTVGLCITAKTRHMRFYELSPEDKNDKNLKKFASMCLTEQ